MTWFQPVPTVSILQYNLTESSGRLALFDLDGTLVRSMRGRFPRDASDFLIFPHRREALAALVEAGYTLVVVTNQGWKGRAKIQLALDRIELIAESFDLPMMFFVSTGHDEYRKPNIGLWGYVQAVFQNRIRSAFYVGDAAGRPIDHSDSDREWAKRIGMIFNTPEDFFAEFSQAVPIPKGKTMALLVGEPGSGKSTFYQEKLEPKGYQHVSQDVLKTKAKTLQAARQALQTGKPVAIDNTNPTQAGRQEYYDLAEQAGYQVVVYLLLRPGEAQNKLRENPVSTMAYNVYFSRFEMPTTRNTPGPIYPVPTE